MPSKLKRHTLEEIKEGPALHAMEKIKRLRASIGRHGGDSVRDVRALRDGDDEAPRPAKVLVADPPWPFRDRLPGPGRGAVKHYNLLDMEALKAFSLPLVASDAWLFLWRVASMQREALDVAEAWGFTPKTELVWKKITKTGKRWFGMGHYLRAEHEVCLVCVRGQVKPALRNVRTMFEAPAGRHSAKPDAFYEIVEKLVPGGPYVELFARRQRPGWACLGDEAQGEGT